jgi:hypothetical protein
MLFEWSFIKMINSRDNEKTFSVLQEINKFNVI